MLPNMMKGLGAPVSAPTAPKVAKGKKFGMKKRKPSNKTNKFAKALSKAPREESIKAPSVTSFSGDSTY